jgi:hypothetical protein
MKFAASLPIRQRWTVSVVAGQYFDQVAFPCLPDSLSFVERRIGRIHYCKDAFPVVQVERRQWNCPIYRVHLLAMLHFMQQHNGR